MRYNIFFHNGVITFTILFIIFSGCIEIKETNDSSWEPLFDNLYQISMITIVDGDTIHANTIHNEQITIRVLGIDTPELKPSENIPYEYDLIINQSCLSMYGKLAKEQISSLLSTGSGFIMFDNNAGLKDIYDRYLCYVFNETMIDVGLVLLKKGLARVYISESFEKKDDYLSIEHDAMYNHTGLWSCE